MTNNLTGYEPKSLAYPSLTHSFIALAQPLPSSMIREREEQRKKYANRNFDVEERSQVMKTGIKLNVTKPIRSSKTGMFLPREGTLVSVTENLVRTLLLVEFEGGHLEYLFEDEVEFETGNAPRQNYCRGTDAHL